MKEKKSLLIYHKEDNDGVFSAAIITYYLLNIADKNIRFTMDDIELLPADYNLLLKKWKSGEVKEWPEKYDNVFMTDISFNDWRAMKFLKDKFSHNFTWIDHHKPAISESNKRHYGDLNGIRDTYKSAILLAYAHYFDPLDINFNNQDYPKTLGALSAYDCWNWDGLGYDGDTCKSINLATNVLVKLDFVKALGLVSEVLDTDGTRKQEADENWFNILTSKGHEYRKHQQYEWDNLMKMYADKEWKVYDKSNDTVRSAAAVFCQGPSSSLMFDSIKEEVQCGIVFKIDKKCESVTVSLYNTKYEYGEEFDCGAWCKRWYSGGGHQGAAGFTIPFVKFCKLVSNKTI